MQPKKHRAKIFGGDLETDNDGETAWIVQSCISDGERRWHDTDVQGIRRTLTKLMWNYGDIVVYYHNLKYDLSFLKPVIAIFQDADCEVRATIRRRAPISIRITMDKTHSVTFRDSMKKLPSDLRQVGRIIGLPKLESPRGSFEPGWSKDLDLSDDSDDWTYIDRDADIVAVAMLQLHKSGRTASTASGDAWQWAKRMIGVNPKTGKYNPHDKKWDNLFPHLDVELDRFLRHGYAGGLNISFHTGYSAATPDRPITHEDVHNMYGSVLMWDPLPIGIPTESDKWPCDDFLYVAHVSIKLTLKDGMIPWFQFKEGIDNAIEGWPHGTIVECTYHWHEMILTSVDLITLSHFYDIEFCPDFCPHFWIFKQREGIFKEYLEYWTAVKESSEKGTLEYTSAKLMINSLYGRFALAPETEENKLEYCEDLGDWDWISEDTLNEESDAYLPYAMFITAYARARLLENVLAVGCENVIHCDTDSVIHFGPPSEDVEHGEHLGTWGIESEPVAIYEGGFKRYIEVLRYPIESPKDISMACAGVPQKFDPTGKVPVGMWVELLDEPSRICETGRTLGQADYRIESDWLRRIYIENGYDPDHVNTCKLIPETVPGGTILRERQHCLNDMMIYRFRR